MARLEDIPEPTRTAVANIPWPAFETTPFVSGPPLSKRRVAIVSSAALIQRGDAPFPVGSGECRPLQRSWDSNDILVSHVSINFDRAGYQRDINVVYPIERLKHLAIDGLIGSVANTPTRSWAPPIRPRWLSPPTSSPLPSRPTTSTPSSSPPFDRCAPAP